MAGLIYGAMGGLGKGLTEVAHMGGEYLVRSQLQEEAAQIQALRDERLAELRKGEIDYAEGVSTKRARAAGAELEKAKGEFVDDPSGTVRQRAPYEERENRASIYRKHGLVREAQIEDELGQRAEEGKQRILDRQADNQRADRELDARISYQEASLALQELAEGRLSSLSDVEVEIKQIALGNAKRAQELRKEYSTATPERKRAIEVDLEILTGNDYSKVLPVKQTDENGVHTGYRLFDMRTRQWVDTATPRKDGERRPLDAFAPGGGGRPGAGGPRPEQPKPEQPIEQLGGPAEEDVLPHERGRRQEAEAARGEAPFLRGGEPVDLEQVRTILSKPRPTAGELMVLESFKDHRDLTLREKAAIQRLLGSGLR